MSRWWEAEWISKGIARENASFSISKNALSGLVRADFCESTRTPSLSNNRYFLVFVDDLMNRDFMVVGGSTTAAPAEIGNGRDETAAKNADDESLSATPFTLGISYI
ncbi:hypothetical protein OIU74_007932 [Salix koriyanagi]|uniref:Uncharacterized protein n=1 Tax=Salix koriyanagi TaxID=2511006 RepID=A0A9Q0Z6T5_9ROSI|nr:hypothetical protein OIU74_007932 [Salix koriyanagi]